MTRSQHFALAALLVWVALLCGCSAAGSLFSPTEEGGTTEAPIQTLITGAANATGVPWIQIAGGIASALLGGLIGKRGAKKVVEENEAKEWTLEEAAALIAKVPPDVLAAALRAGGNKVERA